MRLAAGTSGWFRWIVTVLLDVSTVSMYCQAPSMSSVGYFFSSWNVKSTSFAVKALPSDHFTPSRSVNTMVDASGCSVDAASHGVPLPSRLLMTVSGS
jgi:hypothetical protein